MPRSWRSCSSGLVTRTRGNMTCRWAGDAVIRWAGLRGGESVAVFGCGPVGLMAQKCAWLRGASRVFGLDRESYRLSKAKSVAHAEVINVDKDDWLEILRDATGGRATTFSRGSRTWRISRWAA